MYSLSDAARNDGSGKSAHASSVTLAGERSHPEHLPPFPGTMAGLLIEASSQSSSTGGPEISESFPADRRILSAGPRSDRRDTMHLTHTGEPASGYVEHPLQSIVIIPDGSSSAGALASLDPPRRGGNTNVRMDGIRPDGLF